VSPDTPDRPPTSERSSGLGSPRLTGRQRRAEARRRAEETRQADAAGSRGIPAAVVILGVAALVALLVGIALATGFLSPTSSGGAAGPDATLHTLVKAEAAADVVVDNGRGWTVDDDTGTLRRFDPSSGAFVGGSVHVGQRPVSMAAGYGELWVADAVGNAVFAVNPATGRVVGQPISVGDEPVSVAAGEGGIWVASLQASTVSLIDPRSRSVTASVAPPDGAVRVTTGDGYVWVTGTSNALTRISPKPVGVSLDWKDVRVGQGPIGVTAAPGVVWVADAVGGEVTRLDPTSLTVTGTYRASSDPVAVAVFDGLVWTADGKSGAVTALDPSTGRQQGKAVDLAGEARQLVVSGGTLWATTANPGEVVAISPS
jgi:streptogramin lyase